MFVDLNFSSVFLLFPFAVLLQVKCTFFLKMCYHSYFRFMFTSFFIGLRIFDYSAILFTATNPVVLLLFVSRKDTEQFFVDVMNPFH